VSPHETGDAHTAVVNHEKSEAWIGESGSRYLEEWKAPEGFQPSWRELFAVVHPESQLRTLQEAGTVGVDLVQLPVPSGKALHVCLFRDRDAGAPTKVNLDSSFTSRVSMTGLAVSAHGAGSSLGSRREGMGSAGALEGPGRGTKSLVPPDDFDHQLRGAGLLKLVRTTNGGR